MDKLARYRQLIRQVLEPYSRIKLANGEIEVTVELNSQMVRLRFTNVSIQKAIDIKFFMPGGMEVSGYLEP